MVDTPALLDPLRIASLVSRNRVVFGPHETNLGRDRAISERHVAYYRRRAEGGAGIIITEEASAHPSDWPYERAPLASDCGDGWNRVANACHDEGALVIAALGHAGGQGTSHWSQRELWAPGRVPEVNTREVPKWMEPDDIQEVIAGFGAAARTATEAGCDGVEINAGQFSLVRQFLSGLTNPREDKWGEQRTLFAHSVLAVVRGAVGADRIVALRLSCDELAPWAGITGADAPALATELTGSVDLLTVVRGSIFSAGATRPDGHTAAGFNLELAASVRAAVRAEHGERVRVVAQGSVVDVDQADGALANGVADAVEMTRAHIADPLLVNKFAAGHGERIRPCVLCNQNCAVRDNRNPIVSCVGEPFSGHETDDTMVRGVALQPVDVLVVGGGPAGLEAARVAALRGHRVRVVERSASLGGMLHVVALQPGRDRFEQLGGWLVSECERLGVALVTGHEVGADEAAAASHVIIATGSRDGERGYRRSAAADVRSAPEVLEHPDLVPGGAVLVWDPIGGPTGVAVAEVLAAGAREVHLATPDFVVGNELARSGDMGPANARLAQAGVTFHRRQVLQSVRKNDAVLLDRFSSTETRLAVSVVIDAGARLPDDALYQQLHGTLGHRLHAAGDGVAPRTVYEAILEGRRRALELG